MRHSISAQRHSVPSQSTDYGYCLQVLCRDIGIDVDGVWNHRAVDAQAGAALEAGGRRLPDWSTI
jgi:hypothetical protein